MSDTRAIDKNQLIRFFFAYRQEPESWSDFVCLHIDCGHNTIDLAGGAETILSSYLQNMYYKIYRPDDDNLYVLFRERDFTLVTQALQQVEFYCLWERYRCLSKFYMLHTQGNAFIDHLESVIRPFPEGSDLYTSYFLDLPKPLNVCGNPGHVLLVEDDPITRWMFRQILRGDCLLATASCAHQVYNLYNHWKPSLIFLDINLPDGSGEEILQWILNQDPGANVVMFSGNDDIDTVMQMIEGGAKGFVAKPFDKDKVRHYLHLFSNSSREVYYG